MFLKFITIASSKVIFFEHHFAEQDSFKWIQFDMSLS